MRENEDIVRIGVISIGAELKEDKVRYIEENKELRRDIGEATNKILALSIAPPLFK